MEITPQIYWGVISGALFLAGTFELSKPSLNELVAREFYFNKNPSFYYRALGYLCGIRNQSDSYKEFIGGSWDEIKKNTHAASLVCGLILSVFGFVTLLTSIFNIGPCLFCGV